LSACNTSNGKSLNAEGVLSMARVFTETGAKSVISSNWNTPDKTSYEIVKLYYTFLNEGLSSAEALRAALIKYATDDSISSPSERTPYYWSNWVFTGSDKKLVFEGTKSNNAWMLLALICVAAFLFFIFLKLKQ
jgi:CHAT domain-containing protein